MSNWKVGPGGRLYHPTTGAYVGQLDDNGNEQMVVSSFPSDQGLKSFVGSSLVGSEMLEARRRQEASSRDFARIVTTAGNYTHHLTHRAPAHYDAIQITAYSVATATAPTIKMSVAPSAQYGYKPVDSAGADVAFTPITWGTTDPTNPLNPGGGAATGTPTLATGSEATHDLVEGYCISDIIPVRSMLRTDYPDAPPLIMLRMFSAACQTWAQVESRSDNANFWGLEAIPEFFGGNWGSTDYTASTPGTAPTQNGYTMAVGITFFLRGRKVLSIGVAGDSTDQGWIPATAVPQYGGLLNGYARRFVKRLNDAGEPATLMSLAYQGQKSTMFHARASQAIKSRQLTHLFLKPWSTNQNADGTTSATAAIASTEALLADCWRYGVVPIIVQPWGGQSNGSASRVMIDNYVASLKQRGVIIFDPRPVTDNPDGSLKDIYRTVNAGGSFVDAVHNNDAAYAAMADLAWAQRDYLLGR